MTLDGIIRSLFRVRRRPPSLLRVGEPGSRYEHFTPLDGARESDRPPARAIGNGVPLPLGRAVARAVRSALPVERREEVA